MGVYKIFPSQDTTIYSDYSTLNAGLDSLLDLSKNAPNLYPSSSTSRILMKFDSDDLVRASVLAGNDFTASLKLFNAKVEGIPTNFNIVVNPIYEDPWDMGTGRFNNIPESNDGASWKYSKANQQTPWHSDNIPAGVTASYFPDNVGGTSWFTDYEATQSFSYFATKDINVDVTSTVYAWNNVIIENNGFVIRNTGSIEFDYNYQYIFNFYSRDTYTIYAPYLEFKWNDSTFNPGTTSTVTTENILVSIANNKSVFYDNENIKFRVYAKEKYPQRNYTRTSLYVYNKLLPTSSYYSLIDLDTNLSVVDFDLSATQLSTDSTSSYFMFNMNGLEPDRYYKIQIKSIINDGTYIYDDDYYFKVMQTI
jgi:hypothetical protein